MKSKGLLVPLSYQENEEKCYVCLAKIALDEALDREFTVLEEAASTLLKIGAPVAESSAQALRELVGAVRIAQTEYAVAFAVSLTLYHTVEKPGLHHEAREAVMAYQEYRKRVTESQAEVMSKFTMLTNECRAHTWPQSTRLTLEEVDEAHKTTLQKTSAFWQLVDKWADDRHDKAFDFLDQLT